MHLHKISNANGAVKRKKRLGCGESSGLGKTSGKGHKGQMARSGHKRKPTFEGGQMRLVRRMPKRGFNNPVKVIFAAVNLRDLSSFDDGAEITPEVLANKGLIRNAKQPVKILGVGDLNKKLKVTASAFSATSRKKIEDAGGECQITE